jgi:iron-sulfur cluster repair protein YtfE (RIC family)
VNDRSVQHLMRDHHTCEGVMQKLEAMLDAQPTAAVWGAREREIYREVCDFFEGIVLKHIQKEEEVFFPVLEEFLPRDVGPLAVLRGEHHDIAAAFARLRDAGAALESGAGDAAAEKSFASAGRKLMELVSDHLYKENRVLFPMVARFLSAERDAALLEAMQAIDAA